VERGEVSAETFMEDIAELTRRIVTVQPDLEAVRKLTYYDVDEVGKCPRCGKPVYEHGNGYFCSGENCTFALWKNSSYLAKAGIKLTRTLATELIAEGHAPVENVTFADSHTGELILVEQGGKYPSYKYKATDQERY
jgi:DNA topoisomerase-3